MGKFATVSERQGKVAVGDGTGAQIATQLVRRALLRRRELGLSGDRIGEHGRSRSESVRLFFSFFLVLSAFLFLMKIKFDKFEF